jgi:hypothetical protein
VENKIQKTALTALLAGWYLGASVYAQEQPAPAVEAGHTEVHHPIKGIFQQFQQNKKIEFSPELEALVLETSFLNETEARMLGHYARILQSTDIKNPDLLRLETAYEGTLEFSYATDKTRIAHGPMLEKNLQAVTIRFLRKHWNTPAQPDEKSAYLKQKEPTMDRTIEPGSASGTTPPSTVASKKSHEPRSAEPPFDINPLSALLAAYIQGKDVDFDPALSPVFENPLGYSRGRIEYKNEKLELNARQAILRGKILPFVRQLNPQSPRYATQLARTLKVLHTQFLEGDGQQERIEAPQRAEQLAALLVGFVHHHYKKRRKTAPEKQVLQRLYDRLNQSPYTHFGEEIEQLVAAEKINPALPGRKKRFVEAVQRKREDTYDQLKKEIFSGAFTMDRFKELTAEGGVFHVIHKNGNAATIAYLEGRFGPTATATIAQLRGKLPVEVLERRFESLESFMYKNHLQVGRIIEPAVPSLYIAAHARATRIERGRKK